MDSWESAITPRQPKASKLVPVRHLCTMTRTTKKPESVTAAIYEVETGRGLRVHYGARPDNLLDSLLSRPGDRK